MAREKRTVSIFTSKTGQPLVRDKQQRNELCDCKSGKKAKKCCGAVHRYYDTGKIKKAREEKPSEPEVNTSE